MRHRQLALVSVLLVTLALAGCGGATHSSPSSGITSRAGVPAVRPTVRTNLPAAKAPRPTSGATAATVAPNPRAGCDPSYPTVCIPPYAPDLDCIDVPFRRFEGRGRRSPRIRPGPRRDRLRAVVDRALRPRVRRSGAGGFSVAHDRGVTVVHGLRARAACDQLPSHARVRRAGDGAMREGGGMDAATVLFVIFVVIVCVCPRGPGGDGDDFGNRTDWGRRG